MADTTNGTGSKLHAMAQNSEKPLATLIFRTFLSLVGSGIAAMVAWQLHTAVDARESIVALKGDVSRISQKIDIQHDETERRIGAIETFITTRSNTRDTQVTDLQLKVQHASDKVDDLSTQISQNKNDLAGTVNDLGAKVTQLYAAVARVQACMFGKGGPSCLLEVPR